MVSKDFLLEIGTEPMPARFMKAALDQLLDKTQAALKENRLTFKSARVLGTYRRLAVIVTGLADKSEALDKEVQGPPARLLRDEHGKYTPQADGFARKQGIKPEELTTVNTPKGEFLLAKVNVPGEPAAAILARVLPQVISALEFPKTLEWEETRFRFGRPIRTLTALLGKNVVSFKLAGIKSNRFVCGLPSQGKKPVSLPEPGKYKDALKKLLVLVDPEDRRDALVKRLEGEAKRAGYKLDLDLDLVEETLWMTEHPVPVAGKFKTEFLELPAPLLSLVLKKQLKFFPLFEGSRLAPGFLGVRDGVSEGQALVREGYQRVLSARLSDAVFFFGRDKGASLASRLPMLERVTYQKALGSMAQKSARVAALAQSVCEMIRHNFVEINEAAVAHIAKLCYADLITEVVKEFPELQGAMGGVYARFEHDDERVALGLEQFYFPLSAKSPIPATAEGAIVSLAAKLDTLAGNFAIGNVPTGSADPFALRRGALGAARIALEKQLPVDLEAALKAALAGQPAQHDAPKVLKELCEFVWGRVQTLFEEKGYRVDEIRAVRGGGLANLAKTFLRLCAVASVRKNPEFEPLAASFKRAANILKQAKVDLSNGGAPDRALLKEEAELALYDALVWMEGEVKQKLVADGFEPGLRALVAIKPHLDLFFEKVMVMVDEPVLKAQRLSLLAKLVKLFNCVADLSELQPAAVN
jgi:glycyl-tRNA synthetase beta chain